MLPSFAYAAETDTQALKDLEKFLFNTAERQAYSKQDSKAKAANNYLESFPPWAQQELLEIVMMVMKEEGEGAARHGNTAANSGAQAAAQNFSPAVRARMSALSKKLMNDKSFNNPSNMQKMKSTMPTK
jgi:hypothetical protein